MTDQSSQTASSTAGEMVTITAVDWNGSSFDGSPFEPTPCDWIVPFLQSGHIAVYNDRGSRDYAVWSVLTPNGARLIAYPGDQIHHIDGKLVLTQHPSNQYEDRAAMPGFTQW